MARSRNRSSRRSPTGWPTRPFPTRALVHPVGYPDPDEAFFRAMEAAFDPPSTVRPLIRTVLVEPAIQQKPVISGSRESPLLRSRATGRSSDRLTRSPFLNAQTVSPELTMRALECAKRSIRREVLFATRQTGKGARSPKAPPSKWRC